MAEALATAEALPFPIGPFTQAYVHTYSAWFHELASEPAAAAAHAIRAIELAAEHGYSTWLGAATLHLAIANAAGDSPSDWIPLMECGLDMWAEAGARLFRPYFLFWLADARRRIGEHDRAVEALDEALEQVAGCDERFHESELHRLRGELLLASDPDRPEPAAAELSCAVTVARRQRARTFELRAMTALHRLEAGLGRGDRTAPSLAALVDSFGEARAFPDLVEARTALGRSPS
jgi:predicted ATPase